MSTDIDFVRDGQVGDAVWHPHYGNGEITSIVHHNDYAVRVRFYRYMDASDFAFMRDGRDYQDGWALLCWGHRGSLDRGQPPRREPKPLAFKEPVWAYVSNFPDGWKYKTRRRVIAKSPEGFSTVGTGNDEYNEDVISHWRYAWECEE